MKILAINSSPQKDGTSSTVLNALIKKLILSKNKIEKYDLNKLKIHGCQECFYCRNTKTDICGFKDDMTDILEAAKTTDVLIVATPIFYADISAQLKCFIDRTWSYYGKTGTSTEHLPRHRTLVFIMSYGYNHPRVYDQIYEKYKHYFNMFGFDKCYAVKAYGAQYFTPKISNEDDVNQQIEDISKEILNR